MGEMVEEEKYPKYKTGRQHLRDLRHMLYGTMELKICIELDLKEW